MEEWTWSLMASFLLICATFLMIAHTRTWQAAQRESLDELELEYRRRQFRRRMQSSAMLAILAPILFFGQWVDRLSPIIATLYWGGTLLLVCWLGLLAVADIIATKHYFGRIRQNCIIEQAKLQAKMRNIHDSLENGDFPDDCDEPDWPHDD